MLRLIRITIEIVTFANFAPDVQLKREALIPRWCLAVLEASLLDTQDNLTFFHISLGSYRTAAFTSLMSLVLFIYFRSFLVA